MVVRRGPNAGSHALNTQQLIDTLAIDVRPVSGAARRNQLALSVAVAIGLSGAAVIAVFGVQTELASLAHGLPLLLKLTYALSFAAFAFPLVLDLARPDEDIGTRWHRLGWPVAALALLVVVQLLAAAPVDWPGLVMGVTWAWCPLRITLLSLPAQLVIGWFMRRQAPAHLRLAGAMTGLLSGSLSTVAYAFACTERSPAFVLVWYTAGIAASAAFGALTGPKFLRW
jgi:hypothetical protein